MNKRVTAVQTPGAAPEPATTGEPFNPDEELSNTPLGEPAAPPAASNLPADMQALIAAEVAKGVAAALAAQPRQVMVPTTGKAAPKLPAYDAVVASKPDNPTLTDKGWYVPATYGANPNASKA